MYVNKEKDEETGPLSEGLASRFSGHLSREFLEFICGTRIGHGVSREVYNCRIRPDCVIKIEPFHGHFANVLEATLWEEVKKHSDHAKWFAPVESISTCGRVMLMKKTQPISLMKLPSKMPIYFTDIKHENFGIIDDQIVCHDYAFNRIPYLGLINRLTNCKWT